MSLNIAYKYELITTRELRSKLAQVVGCRRYVVNKVLELQRERLLSKRPFLTYGETSKLLTQMKKEDDTLWLQLPPSQALQQGLMDLNRSIQEYRAGKKGFPHFIARGEADSFRLPQPKQEDLDQNNSRVYIPKIGFVRYRKSREITGTIKQITISVDCGRWYISVVTEIEGFESGPTPLGEVGIDLGVAQTVTLSDGRVFQLDTQTIKKHEHRIEVLQKQLSHNLEARKQLAKMGLADDFDKREPSCRHRKLKAKIQNLYRRIRNIRDDFIKKTSHLIAQEFGWVAMEELKMKNMTKSAKGTVEQPGKNVRAKSGLNRSMLRFSPYAFRRCIEWNLRKTGGQLVLVVPAYTSQRCSCCDHTEAGNRPNQAVFQCLKCGHEANADVNGAINILQKSRTGSVRP